MARSNDRAVGIDLGTATCFVAREVPDARAEVLPVGRLRRSMPAVAGYLGGGLVVGEDAQLLTPDRVIRSIRSAITDRRRMVQVGGRDGAVEVARDEVVVGILREVLRRVRDRGWAVDGGGLVRLGCPAIWTPDQRQTLIDLADAAGLRVAEGHLIEDPVAAGVAWLTARIRAGEPVTGRLLVFDLGAGTLDLAVLRVNALGQPSVTALASAGSPVAGDACDEAIVAELCAERGIDVEDLREPLLARADLVRLAEQVKVDLSEAPSHTVNFATTVYSGAIPPVVYPRERLTELLRPWLTEAERLIWRVLRLARGDGDGGGNGDGGNGDGGGDGGNGDGAGDIDPLPRDLADDVDFVLLVGGMSRMVCVRDRMVELFPRALRYDNTGGTSDEAVVAGLSDAGSVPFLPGRSAPGRPAHGRWVGHSIAVSG